MSDLLVRLVVILITSVMCLPLAFLGITHGSSFGLEAGVSLLIINIIAVVFMIKLEKGGDK